MVVQMPYAEGTLERDAVVDTYAYVQKLILIAGVATVPSTVPSIFMWKNINVKKLEQEREMQTKGTVL